MGDYTRRIDIDRSDRRCTRGHAFEHLLDDFGARLSRRGIELGIESFFLQIRLLPFRG